MKWSELSTVVDAADGWNMSPGILQTLVVTAGTYAKWALTVRPELFTTLKVTPPPANLGGYVTWLLDAVPSIAAGTAYVRFLYDEWGTRFDLPLVGSAYNSGNLRNFDDGSGWYVAGASSYVNRAAPVMNSAIRFFASGPTHTRPGARYLDMRLLSNFTNSLNATRSASEGFSHAWLLCMKYS